MRADAEHLSRILEHGLPSAWLIAGDEALLAGEAADAVRARARAAGHSGREIFVADRAFDWAALTTAARSLSLFAERRILEVRMPTPRPGKEGGAALAGLAADPGPDTLLLVITTRPEKDTWSSAWFKAFEKHGVFVAANPVGISELPGWIARRARSRGLELDEAGAALLAERVEGNLLAAHQEIAKLALLHGRRSIGSAEVQAAVSNSARYDVFQLGEAALAGNASRALRILDGLRAEGAEPPLVLWAICRELRALAAERSGRAPRAFGTQAERRAILLRQAAGRFARAPLGPLFRAAARVDRQSKGQEPGQAWTSLAALVAAFAGADTPALPSG